MIYFCLGHYIRVQPTLHKGDTRKRAAKGPSEAGFLLALPLVLGFSGGWKGAGSSAVISEPKVARTALLHADSLLSRRDELIPRFCLSAGH